MVFLLFILLQLYSVQHWRSAATCATALGLPNLNYVQVCNYSTWGSGSNYTGRCRSLDISIYFVSDVFALFLPFSHLHCTRNPKHVTLLSTRRSTRRVKMPPISAFMMYVILWTNPDTFPDVLKKPPINAFVIHVILLTNPENSARSFLIAHMAVRYSLSHYLLLIYVIMCDLISKKKSWTNYNATIR